MTESAALRAEEETAPEPPGRATLVRDVVALQIKLFLDGLRDLVLSPVSIAVGVWSLLRIGPGGGAEFYRLLHLGRRSERWIRLFAAAERLPERTLAGAEDADVDAVVDRIERVIKAEYENRTLSRAARRRLNRLVREVRRADEGAELLGDETTNDARARDARNDAS